MIEAGMFIAVAAVLILADLRLDSWRRARKDAARRNQARPWR